MRVHDAWRSIRPASSIVAVDTHYEDDQYEADADGVFDNVQMNPGACLITPTTLACVTVYNETLEDLARTLLALLAAFRQARERGVAAAEQACIALIIDGSFNLDSNILKFLIAAGLIDAYNDSEQRTRFFFTSLSLRPLPWHMVNLTSAHAGLEDISFVVCIKDRNRGKLHSHALFFGNLCARLQPRYCFQIDTGTVVIASAVASMLEHLELNPRVAALAAAVTSDAPEGAPGLIKTWQFMEFAMQAAVSWHAEILSGHLSVLPGQCCALRWTALSGDARRSPLRSERQVLESCQLAQKPLDGYLRGMAATDHLQRLMFLAEDRIIGNEIVLAHDEWTLGFCASAHVTTDACTQLGELQRQRRRWNNSSSACRLWLLGRWRSYLGRDDRRLPAKLKFSMAMLWQLLLLIQQLSMPALLAGSMYVVATAAVAAFEHRAKFELLMALVSLLLSVGLALLTTHAEAPARRRWHLARDASFTLSLLLLFKLFSHAMSIAAIAFLIVPYVIGVGLACRAFPRCAMIIARSAAEYLFVSPLMQVYLWTYSILHLHDVSWGTKGLTRSDQTANNMRSLRNLVLVAWLGGNCAMAWIGLSLPPLYFRGLNPLLELSSGLFALTIVMALLGRQRKPAGHVDLQQKLQVVPTPSRQKDVLAA